MKREGERKLSGVGGRVGRLMGRKRRIVEG